VNTSIRVVIPDEAATRLAELARREFRAPRQQAALLLLAGLKNAGFDPDELPKDPVEPSDVPPGSSQLASSAEVGAGKEAHGGDDLPVGA
jgi:hypothetical protein